EATLAANCQSGSDPSMPRVPRAPLKLARLPGLLAPTLVTLPSMSRVPRAPFLLLISCALPRRNCCPGSDTERSQHDFHCQRTKDESHYTDEDGRALSTDHAQNR